MKLISGNTYWPSTLEQKLDFPALTEDLTCDVLIVGGGMGGSLCARLLGEQQVDTVVIDKRKLAHGSSSANTGLLQYSNDKTLTSFINTFGEANGVLFYRMCKDALDQLEKLASTVDIDPSLIRRSSLYYASTPEDVSVLQKEFEQLNRFGFPVEYWDEQQVAARFPFRKPAALYTHEDAEVNPFRFVQGLLQYASRLGVQLYEHTEAKHFKFGDNEVVCHTSGGTIRAKKVIFAAGYESQEIKKDRGAILESSYAIATKPIGDSAMWHEQCLIWETARPYLYIRSTADGRVIIGGWMSLYSTRNSVKSDCCTNRKNCCKHYRSIFPIYHSRLIMHGQPSLAPPMMAYRILARTRAFRTATFWRATEETVQSPA